MMQRTLPLGHELIVDNFAGGGGTSTGIEQGIGRLVDIAINHDPEAVAMHRINHPDTTHYCESVWEIDPRQVTAGRPVGLVWLSPDCKHFSKAKGGKPVEKKVRGLAWVTLRWAATVRPRVIMLENVEEFVTWGPLVEGPDGKMRPCPRHRGREFNAFCNALRRHGYAVEHRELRACDFGAPTIRKRLFLIARRDSRPIVWPEPTHGNPNSEAVKQGQLKPWRAAAECIDWSIPCPSIFERARPLADATLRRIAKGIMRYVVDAEPFIVPITHHGSDRVHALDDPLRTITCAQRGEFALVRPFISTYYGAKRPNDVRGCEMTDPLPTQTTENRHAVVAAFLAQHNTERRGVKAGRDLRDPVSTITATAGQQALVAAQIVGCGGRAGQSRPRDASEPMQTITAKADTVIAASSLVKLRGTCRDGQALAVPAATISAQGLHLAEVRAFLIKYYGTDQDPNLTEPMHTLTTRDRFGLVTVEGEDYAIVDIGMRMLSPRELYRAQGFPEHYIIGDDPAQGLTLTKSAQVRMVGNSVCPPVAAALVRANFAHEAAFAEVAA